jgi:hypothetical protein
MIPRPDLWSRGGVCKRPLIPEEVLTPIGDKSTDHARGRGQVRQEKWVRNEMIDVAGRKLFPVPSLGGAPRIGGPTTRRLGVTRTIARADCMTIDRSGNAGAANCLQTSRWRSRGACEFPPGDRSPPTSSRGCTRSRGVRVHRGEPLLLGVDEEYQISYRLFGGKTAEMAKIPSSKRECSA